MKLAVTGPVYDTDRLLDEPFVISSVKTDFLVILGGCDLTVPRVDLEKTVEEFSSLPCGVLFIDAERDDHDLLAEYPAYPWNGGLAQMFSRNVYRLCRGQVFDLCGLKVLTLGGRSTPSRDDSERYWSWWPEQDPSVRDVYSAVRALDGGLADLVLTSDVPSSWRDVSDASAVTVSQEILEHLRNHIRYDRWLFADGSPDHELPEHDASCLLNRVLRIA